jgi:hypothetical protein
VLIAVALPRPDLPRDLPVEAAASLGHHAMGFLFAACGRLTGRRPFAHERTHDGMPVQDGDLTVRQVRRAAAELLPGVRVRPLLFWRYLLLWRRPS